MASEGQEYKKSKEWIKFSIWGVPICICQIPDWEGPTLQTMGDIKEPLLMGIPSTEPNIRTMMWHPIPNVNEPEEAPANGEQEIPCEEKSPLQNNPKSTVLGKEKPLQENTVSSSLKLEAAGGNQVQKKNPRDGKKIGRKGKSRCQQEKAESALSEPFLAEGGEENSTTGLKAAMDFVGCNGHSASRLSAEPVIKKIRLESEQRDCETRDENKPVSSKRVKETSPCSLDTDSTVAEERRKTTEKKKPVVSGAKQEKEVHAGQEERLGCSSKARAVEQQDLVGVEKQKSKKLLRREKKNQGVERDSVERKRFEVEDQVKAEQEPGREDGVESKGGDGEMAKGLHGEESAKAGRVDELGMPLKAKTEDDFEEQSPAERRKSRAEETQQEGMEEKNPRSKRKRATPKGKSSPGSRKRKAEEEGGRPRKRKKAEEETRKGKANVKEEKWRWWEEEKQEDGIKWHHLEHKGPYFAPPYEPLPGGVNFYYNGKPMKLSLAAEEVASFYAKMLDHEYAAKKVFKNNFFNDWTKEMTPAERKKIKDLGKCDFREIHKYFVDNHEAKKALSREEKQKLKEAAERIQEEFGYCLIDGHREKIGNFKTEPPGLFRGRGDHPKMGMLKKRILPEDVIINCSKDSKIPVPPPGHRWKEVRCDNMVTWLASWTENIQGAIKYVMLNPSSKLKGEKDWQKYELARRLKGVVDNIRAQYRADWKSKEMKKRQRSVALYFIDRLALRAGNEKEEGETADTVGCCSLRVEHITLHPQLDGKENVVEFDFLGKDCIRYYNKVPVEKKVFKSLQLFMENKEPGDDLFDRLSTASLNKHLQDLMDGLTAKVFRTYNASITLQEQLEVLTNEEDNVTAKLLSYNRANRAVAILCNHQRATPKTFEKSMQNLQAKIDAKKQQLKEAKAELKKAKADRKGKKDEKSKVTVEKKKKLVERIEEQLAKLNMQATDKEENKQIALGTSKLNYLDPRISVAWCKRFGVPIEKIYNKTQREKFAWAIAMADENFEF